MASPAFIDQVMVLSLYWKTQKQKCSPIYIKRALIKGLSAYEQAHINYCACAGNPNP